MSACFTFTYTKADWFHYYHYYLYIIIIINTTVIIIFYLLWREAESQFIGQPGVDPQCKYIQTGMQILQVCKYVQKCTNRVTNIFSPPLKVAT